MKHESMLHAARAILVAGAFLVAACAPSVVSAQATDETTWARARQLADEGRYAESLEAIRVALAAQPDDTGLLWLRAGVTNQAGNHAEAVRLYDALLAAHPELADDTALDRAEALAFAGRLDEAEAVYDAVLSRDPGNTQARAGHARLLNWGGQHRAAALLYRQVQRDDPTESAAAEGLAFAEYWAGRNDLARQALMNVPAGGDPEIEDLRRRLDEERRPSLTVRYGSSHDSDDLDVRTGQFVYREPVGERDAFDFTLRADRVEDEAGGYDLMRMVWGHERVWSHAWQTHAYAGVVVEEVPDHPFLFDTWVTYRPLDALRFDLGVAREQVLTRDAVALGITYFSPSLSAGWWMTRRWLARLAHRQNFYSDDNRTWLTNGALRYRVIARRELKLDLGPDASHLASENDLANGYYDPASYVEAGGTAELAWEPKTRWELGLAGRAGSQKEQGGTAELYYGVDGRLELPLSRRFRLGLEGGSSDSNLSSESGYRRTAWGVSLTTAF